MTLETLFAPPGGFAVRILDLSGANGVEPLETVRGFQSLMHANGFARAYVRDSLERCRAPGLDADKVLAAWFAFGEDAIVDDEAGWRSAAEIRDFAARQATSEERNWRALDPRRHGEDEETDAGEDDDEDDGGEDGGQPG
jgi:hypothetical protein